MGVCRPPAARAVDMSSRGASPACRRAAGAPAGAGPSARRESTEAQACGSPVRRAAWYARPDRWSSATAATPWLRRRACPAGSPPSARHAASSKRAPRPGSAQPPLLRAQPPGGASSRRTTRAAADLKSRSRCPWWRRGPPGDVLGREVAFCCLRRRGSPRHIATSPCHVTTRVRAPRQALSRTSLTRRVAPDP